METGKKKTLWYNDKQLEQLIEIQEMTGESASLIVRKGMDLYLQSLKK